MIGGGEVHTNSPSSDGEQEDTDERIRLETLHVVALLPHSHASCDGRGTYSLLPQFNLYLRTGQEGEGRSREEEKEGMRRREREREKARRRRRGGEGEEERKYLVQEGRPLCEDNNL